MRLLRSLACLSLAACTASATWAQRPCEAALREPSALDLRPAVPPLLVAPGRPGQMELSWENTRAEFVLSRGSLLTLRSTGYDHRPLECALRADRTTVADEPGSFYYLVAARSATLESSTGRDSLGRERPGSSPPCEQAVFSCPGAGLRSETPVDGACIAFATPESTFTLAEAAAGIQVDYAVIIDAGAMVTPWDEACGCCGIDWSPSGLWLAEVLSGADELYCICDDGVDCDCAFVTHPLESGTHPGTFDWEGRNGEVPWDPGPPFPPGTYTLEVTAVGYWEDAPGGRRWFTIAGTHLVTLVP